MRVVRSLVARLTLVPVAVILWGACLSGQPQPVRDKPVGECIADLKSDDVKTRRAAAARLGEIPRGLKFSRRMPDAVAALIEALKDPDPTVRANAVESLPWVGGPHVNDPQVRAAVTKSDLPAILAAVKDPEAVVRAKAASALAVVNADAKTSSASLADLLNDPSASVRLAAVRGLGDIASKADVLSSVLLARKDDDGEVRAAAVKALGAVGGQRKEAVSALVDALRDREPDVRAAAYELSDRLRWNPRGLNPAKDVVPVLLELARDKSYPSRSAAVKSIGQIGPDAAVAVPVLTEVLKDPDAQQAAVHALGQYGARAKSALPDLRELAKTTAAKTGLTGADVVVALLRIDPDGEETWTAFKALALRGRRAATSAILWTDRQAKEKATVKAILLLLQDPDVKVRAASVHLVQRTLAPDAQTAVLPLLLAALKNQEAPAGELAAALGPMKALAKEAVPDLLKAFALEKDEDARESIRDALMQIDPEAAKKAGKP